MELVSILTNLIRIIGSLPLVVVIFMWSQGYVDEFYPNKNQAPWIDDILKTYGGIIKIYWAITLPFIVAGYIMCFTGHGRAIGIASLLATLLIVLAIVMYFLLIKDFPSAAA